MIAKNLSRYPYVVILVLAFISTRFTIIPLSTFFISLACYLPGNYLLRKMALVINDLYSRILSVLVSLVLIMVVFGLGSWVLYLLFKIRIMGPNAAFIFNCILGCTFFRQNRFKFDSFNARAVAGFKSLRSWIVIPAVTLPLMGFVGCEFWNNGSDNTIDTVATFIATVMLLLLLLTHRSLSSNQIALLLFSGTWTIMIIHAGLGGGMLPGSDPKSEFATATHLLQSGFWYPSSGANTYTAMLSITVLPATFSLIGHISVISSYRFIFIFFFAFFPLLAFKTALTLSTKGIATFLTVFWIIASTNFTQLDELPYRQGIANLFIAASIMTLCFNGLKTGQKRTLLLIFFLGVTVSHYSTAYFFLAIILIVCIVKFPIVIIKKIQKKQNNDVILIRSGVAFLVMIIMWEAVINPLIPNQYHTIKQVQKVAKYAPKSKSVGFSEKILKGNPSSNASPTTSNEILYLRFSTFGAKQPQSRYVAPFSPSDNPELIYFPQYPGLFTQVVSDRIKTAALLFKTFFQLITPFEFAAILFLPLVFLTPLRRRFLLVFSKLPKLEFEIYLLGFVTFLFGVGIKVSAQFNYLYTAARSILAIYFLILPLLIIGFYRLYILIKNRKIRVAVFAVSFIFTALALMTGAYLGNQWLPCEPRMDPKNTGEGAGLVTTDEDINQVKFYLTYHPGRLVYAGDLFLLNNLDSMVAPEDISVVRVPSLMNQTLLKGSFIFLSRANLTTGRATVSDPASGLRYQYPIDFSFLEKNSFPVFESPSSEIRMIRE